MWSLPHQIYISMDYDVINHALQSCSAQGRKCLHEDWMNLYHMTRKLAPHWSIFLTWEYLSIKKHTFFYETMCWFTLVIGDRFYTVRTHIDSPPSQGCCWNQRLIEWGYSSVVREFDCRFSGCSLKSPHVSKKNELNENILLQLDLRAL